jgi:hypothetical protein
MIETGCYIDNSAGVYTQLEVCERLVDIGRYAGAKLGRWPIGRLPENEDDRFQWLYEIEIELEEKINLHLMEHHGLSLQVYDGAYCIVTEAEAQENEGW